MRPVGKAAWRSGKSIQIESNEVWCGILDAAEVIGRTLLEPQVFSTLRSERYRSILRKISDKPMEMRFQRSILGERIKPDERKVMDNSLKRMKELGARSPDLEVRGGYRFQNHLHALYFWMEAERAKRERP
jgi:hypothetical protein